jgi:hypothetical protein
MLNSRKMQKKKVLLHFRHCTSKFHVLVLLQVYRHLMKILDPKTCRDFFKLMYRYAFIYVLIPVVLQNVHLPFYKTTTETTNLSTITAAVNTKKIFKIKSKTYPGQHRLIFTLNSRILFHTLHQKLIIIKAISFEFYL